jgi:hypothetical protein
MRGKRAAPGHSCSLSDRVPLRRRYAYQISLDPRRARIVSKLLARTRIVTQDIIFSSQVNTFQQDRTLRVIGYVRVSTDMQAQEGVSLDAQRERIRCYCKAS